jgi:hypothetical protein
MPFAERFIIDAELGHVLGFSTLQATLHSTLHQTVELIPAQSQLLPTAF